MFEYMNYTGTKLKTLVVYPTLDEATIHRDVRLVPMKSRLTDLPYSLDEVMQIVEALEADVLPGHRATIHNFLDHMRWEWDIIWLVTHGEEAGWYLADGIVTPQETVPLIRSSGTFLTVMNTCSSEKVARAVANELGTAFICTVREIPDRLAMITGILFAQNLASGMDYVTAYEQAKPGDNGTYLLIKARDAMPSPERGRFISAGNVADAETINRFIQSVAELDAIVRGSERLGVRGLRGDLKSLETEFSSIKETLLTIQNDVSAIKNNQGARNRIFYLAGSVLIIVLVILVIILLIPGAL